MFPRIVADAWTQLSVRQVVTLSPPPPSPEEGELDLRVETVTPNAIASTTSPNTARARLTPVQRTES